MSRPYRFSLKLNRCASIVSRVIVEGGIIAHVHNTIKHAIRRLGADCVHTIFRYKVLARAQVRRGEADAPLLAVHHFARKAVGPAEQLIGKRNLPQRYKAPHGRAAHGNILDGDIVDDLHLKVKYVAHLLQQLDGPLAVFAEGIVMADNNFPRMNAVDNNVFDKLLRRLFGKLPGEVFADKAVNADGRLSGGPFPQTW